MGSGTKAPRVVVLVGLAVAVSIVVAFAVDSPGSRDPALRGVSLGAVVVGLVVLTAAGVVGDARARRRADEVAAWARATGWRYQGRSVTLPGAGGRDVLHGLVNGVEITSYTGLARAEVSGRRPVLEHHVVVAHVATSLPTLSLVPELPRLAGEVVPDMTLESAEFNARWRVRCADVRFARAFCHPRLMQRLLRPDAAGLSIHVEGRDVALTAPGRSDLAALPTRARLLADVVDLVPPYLAHDHAAAPLDRRPRPGRRRRPAPWGTAGQRSRRRGDRG